MGLGAGDSPPGVPLGDGCGVGGVLGVADGTGAGLEVGVGLGLSSGFGISTLPHFVVTVIASRPAMKRDFKAAPRIRPEP